MQAKRGLVSVIILSYKQFAYIYETIDSVLMQDYPAIEIVIADDGSPNFPQNEIVSYIEKNKRDNIQGYTLLHDGVNVGTNLLHPLISQGFGGVAPKVFLQLPTYTTFCNYLHFCFAKNSTKLVRVMIKYK